MAGFCKQNLEVKTMKLQCKYCKIVFICETFEQVGQVQTTQCYVTREGLTHDLKAVK